MWIFVFGWLSGIGTLMVVAYLRSRMRQSLGKVNSIVDMKENRVCILNAEDARRREYVNQK